MRNSKSLCGWLLLWGALCFSTVPGFGQINAGTLTGLVADPSGSVLADADVSATQVDTQAQYSATTNSEGVYTIVGIPIGEYTVTVKRDGFKTFTQSGVLLDTGAHKSLDVTLQVGSLNEHVDVTASVPLETVTGQYTETENVKSLQDLPLQNNGGKRAPTDYLAALPGVQQGPGFGNQINGSVGMYSDIYVDGAPLESDPSVRGWSARPFVADAVQEVKIVQTPMADLGNNGGVAIVYTTKSGSNQLHGSAFEYLQSTTFNAACWFCTVSPGRSSRTPEDHQDEYGFYLGGPVFIPKVYDGRNKTFFWFHVGHYHDTFSSPPTFFSVPTDAWKTGNFADVLTNQQIGTDVLGRPVFAGEVFDPSTTRTVNGTLVRDPFPGNVVTSPFSTISTKVQTFFPEPNRAGDVNNYFAQGGVGSSPDQFYTIKLEHNIGNKDHISGVYWASNNPYVTPFNYPDIWWTNNPPLTYGKSLRLHWSHTFNPNLVHSLTGGIDRLGVVNPPTKNSAIGGETFGLKNETGTCTPGVGILNISTNQSGFAGQCYIHQWSTPFTLYDSWNYVRGKHLISFGGDLMRFNLNWDLSYNQNFNFGQSMTGQYFQPNCPLCQTLTGSSYASFLLGDAAGGSSYGLFGSDPRSIVYGVYVQDQFKVTKRLTLTYGLRYDVQPFPREAHDRWTSFDPTRPNAAAGGHLGALTFDGYGPGRLNTRDLAPSTYWRRNFGPKIGLAYLAAKNTVLHGAWSWSYGPDNESGFLYASNQGFFPEFSTTSLDGVTPAFNWDNGYPFPPGVPLYNNTDPTAYNGSGSLYYGKKGGLPPTIENVHADVQHLFPGGVVVTAGYNGTFAHGVMTTGLEGINSVDYSKYGRLGNLLLQNINSPAAQAANIPLPYPGFQGTVAQALRPFPQYYGIFNQVGNEGIETYNALQITAQKEFSNGLSFLAGYTFSKEFTNFGMWPGAGVVVAPQDYHNLRAEKTVAAYTDIPHQVTFNYTYQLPVGRGKKLNINSRALDAVVGGWSIAGIHNYQSGAPMGVFGEEHALDPGQDGTIRPNVVPGVPIRTNVSCGNFNPFKDVYLNVNAFQESAPFAFGNTRPFLANVRFCNTYNESVSLYKSFLLKEGLTLRIGGDFFNVLNRHIWGGPVLDIDNPAFGQITSQANAPRVVQLNARISW